MSLRASRLDPEPMNFGDALNLLKAGRYVARYGWNGRNMFLYLWGGNDTFQPCIVMYTAQGKHQPGWLASQADMLADDWVELVHDEPVEPSAWTRRTP